MAFFREPIGTKVEHKKYGKGEIIDLTIFYLERKDWDSDGIIVSMDKFYNIAFESGLTIECCDDADLKF